MDITTLTQLIGTLGFPIVMCGALFWKMNKQDQDHREEVQRLADVIEQNTTAIKLLEAHMSSTVELKKEV